MSEPGSFKEDPEAFQGPVAGGTKLAYDHFGAMVRGSAILDFFRVSEGTFLLQLTGGLKVVIEETAEGIAFGLRSSLVDLSAMPIPIETDRMTPDLDSVLSVLGSINAIYTIIMGTVLGRVPMLEAACRGSAVESGLVLHESERLTLHSLGAGSFLATLASKAKDGAKALYLIALTFGARSREAVLRRMEAEAARQEAEASKAGSAARVADQKARQETLKTNKLEFEHFKTLHEYYEKVIKKRPVDDPIRMAFEHHVRQLNKATRSDILTKGEDGTSGQAP